MAERRMFAKTIVDSDAFLDMPLSAQALYFHLAMRADDDGFVNNPKKIQRMIGASDDDCKLLVLKRFILTFESGVIVIKHWRMHNYIQNDRYKETNYIEEKQQLEIEKNKAYTLKNNVATECIQNGYTMDTQVRLGKVRLGKESIELEKVIGKEEPAEPPKEKRKRFTPPTLEEVKAYCAERNNNVDAERFIDHYTSNGWKVGKNSMKDWKATVRTWERNNFAKPAGNVGANGVKLDQRQNDDLDEVF